MSEIVLLIFPSREAVVDAVDHLSTLDYLNTDNTAFISKAADGETTVYEDDISPLEGAVSGGTLGSLMSALGIAQLGAFLLPGVGPIIAIGAGAILGGLVGGATGSVIAKLLDFGFNNDQLEALAQRLQKGEMALVIAVTDYDVALTHLYDDMRGHPVEIILPPQE